MIPMLSSSAWREFRGMPSRSGINTTTHLALIEDSGGNERKCFLKLINLHTSPGLLCEGLGWLFAKAAGIEAPGFASVVMVPLARLAPSVPSLPPWLSGHTEYPAWCVEVVDGKSMAEVHKWIFWLRRRQCLGSAQAPILAAFDTWADNRDRNYGNVIRTKKGKYVAIDHETLLHDLIVTGLFGMVYEERSLLKEAERHMPPAKFLQFQCRAAAASLEHDNVLQNAGPDALNYLSQLITDPVDSANLWMSIHQYLKLRAQPGWLSNHLGVTI